MKRIVSMLLLALLLAVPAAPSASAAEAACYSTSVTRSEDGTEMRKIYDLGPEEDPAGIPRSDFQLDGFRYTLTDLLKQELPERETRQHTETVSLESKRQDMASVLALLPQQRDFVTEDGLAGTLALQLETVRVEPSGCESTAREVSVTRSYPGLASQDISYIPKTVTDNGRTLTLQTIRWQTDDTSGERFTAEAAYTGTVTSSYVKGYTVTAEYSGTVSRIALNKTRYVAIFAGEPVEPPVTVPEAPAFHFKWAYVLAPLGLVAAAGGGIGGALLLKRRREEGESE